MPLFFDNADINKTRRLDTKKYFPHPDAANSNRAYSSVLELSNGDGSSLRLALETRSHLRRDQHKYPKGTSAYKVKRAVVLNSDGSINKEKPALAVKFLNTFPYAKALMEKSGVSQETLNVLASMTQLDWDHLVFTLQHLEQTEAGFSAAPSYTALSQHDREIVREGGQLLCELHLDKSYIEKIAAMAQEQTLKLAQKEAHGYEALGQTAFMLNRGGKIAVVSEWAEGMELFDAITPYYDTGAPLPLPVIHSWLNDIAKQVAAAHKKGVILADLKIENVMVNQYAAKIVDMGGYTMLGRERELHPQFTLEYLDDRNYDAYMSGNLRTDFQFSQAMDIRAMGLIIAKLLTPANLACVGDYGAEEMIRDNHVSWNPKIPVEYTELVELAKAMLQEDPDARPTIDVVCEKLLTMSARPSAGAGAGAGAGAAAAPQSPRRMQTGGAATAGLMATPPQLRRAPTTMGTPTRPGVSCH